ncbi:MAG: DNA-formamidopyrimidine glycosylase [Candidatus Wildermuthbacteria bacterium RIFCSPHIGHO2_01_FULL_47_27]|uniref:DNA-formamidopyrimidine glycosylase n=2 Tax=Candidatus Wildermuthiibacteriota TaxID=1817923 RepID=A0A1G2RNJ8_9BACT|nr:MAG: DNA-formamidopyrimidine glycosylase [Candidatus Wildermuthbacteria bacterium RIFCSPHIGHO2_01_FULL_47_27]OHA66962.1 MAG: DNA-formamidopyrimidine glycosylase [Candidatus Wildermuthbacteria bacterium RIFCSPHIGHO2_02_FULL_47_17]OHA73852.1 MAG: DNA-formamidopyrimidine glycosylase [Candidatus Wildermuthbacteria bacterium RIFCSPLOWO2_01_FULL_48_35]
MPELPEAEITKRKLVALLGKRIIGFWSDWPRGLRITKTVPEVARDIKGLKVIRIRRQGKVIFFEMRKGGRAGAQKLLAFHQRMSGALILKSHVREIPRHIHHRVIFAGEELLFRDPRKFGVVWYGRLSAVMADSYLARLGQDMLSVSFAEFKDRLSLRKGMIKALLLRQDVFSGIGNIIADEALWRAKIHPKKRSVALLPSEVRKLYNSIRGVIKDSIMVRGTSMRDWEHPDGSRGQFQRQLKVYGLAGKVCGRCKKERISRILVGGRGTWICSNCQK